MSAAERWDAEVNYLRLVGDELATAGGDAAAVLAAHPRYAALAQVRSTQLGGRGEDCVHHVAANQHVCSLQHTRPPPPTLQKYGELAPAAPRPAAGSALAGSMAQLTICHSSKTLEKKLPGAPRICCVVTLLG